ncbi:DUF6252 family protein [Pontibacter russatus]|uniref:DUF6252 family protein n=1 Tax=Pontibacter russatus TaxID=2694929 RepID=UPI00137B40B2|nr:DUF6252 family protein [Pontibacter russatus]
MNIKMKKVYNKFSTCVLAAFTGLLVLPGCSSDDDAPTPASTAQSSITAKVNNADWASSKGSFKLGTRTVSNGASAFTEPGDTLTIIGVQVQGADTTAIVLSVKLDEDKVGTYRLGGGTDAKGKGYFLTRISNGALEETKARYEGGISNGELQITEYNAADYSVSGSFGFSMSVPEETTYTVVAGKIEDVTF